MNRRTFITGLLLAVLCLACVSLHQSWRGADLYLEPGFSEDTKGLLRAKGHQLKPQQTMSSTQFMMASGRLLFGAADTRRPGAAAIGVQIN